MIGHRTERLNIIIIWIPWFYVLPGLLHTSPMAYRVCSTDRGTCLPTPYTMCRYTGMMSQTCTDVAGTNLCLVTETYIMLEIVPKGLIFKR